MNELDFLMRAAALAGDRPMSVRALAMLVYLSSRTKAVQTRALAASLGVPKPSVTRHITTLSHYGLTYRHRDGKDKRDSLIEATPEGRAFVAAICEQPRQEAA